MTPTRELFLDRRLFFYVILVIIMSGYDAVATMQHIGRGVAAEGNPLMESLIERSALLFFFVKMAITTFCMYVFYRFSHKKAARIGIQTAVGLYSLLCVYHSMIILFG
ncbi:MAG: DUF5658 family protein [Acidobacteriota bacterium]